MKVKQHIPQFVDGLEPKEAIVSSQAEMLSLPWLKRWESDAIFDHWEKSEYGTGTLLMGIYKNGEYWVAAYIDGPEKLDLPTWKAKPSPAQSGGKI